MKKIKNRLKLWKSLAIISDRTYAVIPLLVIYIEIINLSPIDQYFPGITIFSPV